MFHRPHRVTVPLCLALTAIAALVLPGVGRGGQAVAQEPAETIDISQGCMTNGCHADMLKPRKVHSAVELEMCDVCHVAKGDKHEFEPPAPAPDLCFECHDPFPTDQVTHAIVELGECLACHDPHGSKIPELLVADSVGAMCAECHGNPADDFPYKHGPARDGKCLGCHQPHVSKYPKLLNKQDGELCLSCHSRSMRRKAGGFIKNIASIIANSEYVHGPVALEECLVCHGPHGGQSPPSLAHPFPPRLYAPFTTQAYELCFQCHGSTFVTEVETKETGFRDGTHNLHYVHVHRDKGRSCRICHNPHGTDQPAMIRTSVPFGAWDLPLRFTPSSTGGSCWPGCHQERSYDRNRAPAEPLEPAATP